MQDHLSARNKISLASSSLERLKESDTSETTAAELDSSLPHSPTAEQVILESSFARSAFDTRQNSKSCSEAAPRAETRLYFPVLFLAAKRCEFTPFWKT